MYKSKKSCSFSLFLKSQIPLTMKHKTKHEDHQRREDEVANLWRIWMSANITKNGSNAGNTLIWEKNRARASSLVKWAPARLEEEEVPIYRGSISTGWWRQLVLKLPI